MMIDPETFADELEGKSYCEQNRVHARPEKHAIVPFQNPRPATMSELQYDSRVLSLPLLPDEE
jgi:hypothetical protein